MGKSKNVNFYREAALSLSAFSRSAFEVGLSVVESKLNPGRCYCSLLAAGDMETSTCRSFRASLFKETSGQRVRCPAGLSMIALPVNVGDEEKIVLLSDGFFEEGVSPSDMRDDSAALHQELLKRKEEDIPLLSGRNVDLLTSFMEHAGALLSLVPDSLARYAPSALQEYRLPAGDAASAIVGSSEGIVKIRNTLPTYANSREPILIESEQGNGRHLIANLIHKMGPRNAAPFICENLSLLPEALHDKEIFGPKGDGRGGLIEYADSGTLFLDGIKFLSSSTQKKLFNLLGKGTREANGRAAVSWNVRILAATDHSLTDLVRRGRFRVDLQRHLSRLSMFIPPLRERREDIPLLVQHFIGRKGNGRKIEGIDREAIHALMEYPWPGNVRELENELDRAASFGQPTIGLTDLSSPIQHAASPPRASVSNIREAVGSLETEMISKTLSETNWNKSQAARILGLSRLGLQKKIDRYGLDRRR